MFLYKTLGIVLSLLTINWANIILSDFQDGKKGNSLGGYWFTYDDVKNNGGNTITTPFINYEEADGNRCGHFQYQLGDAYEHRFSGMATNTGSTTAAGKGSADFSNITALNLKIKGSGHALFITFQSPLYENSNMWVYKISSTSTSWISLTINIPEDLEEAFTSSSKPVKDWDLMKHEISAIQFKASSKISGESGYLYVDNIELIGDATTNPIEANDPVLFGEIFNCDFNNETPGIYTWEDVQSAWNNPVFENGISEERCHIVNDSNAYDGNSLRIAFPSSNGGYGSANTGAQWFLHFEGGGAYDSLFAEYYLMFPEDFDFVKGGKLPGLGGGIAPTGGQEVTGYNGFTNRYMWRKNSSGADSTHAYGAVYSYCRNKPDTLAFGLDLWWDNPTNSIYHDFDEWTSEGKAFFETGKWHRIKQFVKMNSAGKSDGVVKTWLDGDLVQVCDTMRYLEELASNTLIPFKVDLFYFSTFFGGGDSSWATPKDQYVYFDNFKISEIDPSPEDTDINIKSSQKNANVKININNKTISIQNCINESAKIELFSINGKKVTESTGNKLPLNKISTGTYICRIIINGLNIKSQKLVIR